MSSMMEWIIKVCSNVEHALAFQCGDVTTRKKVLGDGWYRCPRGHFRCPTLWWRNWFRHEFDVRMSKPKAWAAKLASRRVMQPVLPWNQFVACLTLGVTFKCRSPCLILGRKNFHRSREYWAAYCFLVAHDILGRRNFSSLMCWFRPRYWFPWPHCLLGPQNFRRLVPRRGFISFIRCPLLLYDPQALVCFGQCFFICAPLPVTYFPAPFRCMEVPFIRGLCFTMTVSNIAPTFAYQYVTYFWGSFYSTNTSCWKHQ